MTIILLGFCFCDNNTAGFLWLAAPSLSGLIDLISGIIATNQTDGSQPASWQPTRQMAANQTDDSQPASWQPTSQLAANQTEGSQFSQLAANQPAEIHNSDELCFFFFLPLLKHQFLFETSILLKAGRAVFTTLSPGPYRNSVTRFLLSPTSNLFAKPCPLIVIMLNHFWIWLKFCRYIRNVLLTPRYLQHIFKNVA